MRFAELTLESVCEAKRESEESEIGCFKSEEADKVNQQCGQMGL